MLDVSDGYDQSLSTGCPVRLHWCQITLAVSSPSKGKKNHAVPYVFPLSHTNIPNTHTYSVPFLQYNAFFEFNDRLEAVMSKAYIYR